MTTFTEITYISQFDIQPNGCIGIRKTTDVLKDGVVISSTYWRCVLIPNDPQAPTVLNEQYYLDIATYAWSMPSPQPYEPNPPVAIGDGANFAPPVEPAPEITETSEEE